MELFAANGQAQPENWTASYPVKWGLLRALSAARLPAAAYRVAIVLLDRANAQTGACFVGGAKIAADLGGNIDPDTIRRAVRAIQGTGLLAVEVSRNGRSANEYFWRWDQAVTRRPGDNRKNAPPAGMRPPSSQECAPPPRRNAPRPPAKARAAKGEGKRLIQGENGIRAAEGGLEVRIAQLLAEGWSTRRLAEVIGQGIRHDQIAKAARRGRGEAISLPDDVLSRIAAGLREAGL